MNIDSETLLLLLDESPDGLIATTAEGEIVFWSKGAEVLFGYSAEETRGRFLNDIIVPADRAEEGRQILNGAIRDGYSTYETVRRRKDGSFVHVDISCKAIREANGSIKFILTNEKDVTHLKISRDAKLVEARFGDLLESSPDAIVITNPTGRIVYANTQAERLFGYERGELIGKIDDLLLPARYHADYAAHKASYSAQPRIRSLG